MAHKRITWEMFDCLNADKTTAFENLCNLLFKRMFFDKKAIFESIPNNPGVEIAPIYSRAINKRISFQSKYFTSEDNKYAQIQKSAKAIIANYKGEIDVVYLYSNKKLNTKCKAYINIEKLLHDEKIELVPIVDEEILNTVIEYPELSQMYFNTGRLTIEWFREKFEESKDIIGHRYTPNFNVETEAEKYLNLFVNNKKAVKNINGIKKDAINNIKDNKWYYRDYNDLMERVAQYIANIPDVCFDTIIEAFGWSKNLYATFEKELIKIKKIIDGKKSKEQELREEGEYKKAADIYKEIRELEYIANVHKLIALGSYEKSLIANKCLLLKGEAGIGKTHLLASMVEAQLNDEKPALLFLGTTMTSALPLQDQIINSLGLDIKFDELLDLLEVSAEEKNCIATLFIDAINESANKTDWERFIVNAIRQIKKRERVKIVFSIRTGYEKVLFKDDLLQDKKGKDLMEITHYGFNYDSIESIKSFLDFYNVVFSPVDYLQHKMTNPLFLKMFCETHDGQLCDFGGLFEKFIKNIDREVSRRMNTATDNLLWKFINEFIEMQLANNMSAISKESIMNFSFWRIYGLEGKKLDYLLYLNQAGLLISFISDETNELYYIGFNLLENYLTAKYIIETYTDKDTLLNFLRDDLFKISEYGRFARYYATDLVGFICGLYSEKYKAEIFEELNVSNMGNEQEEVVSEYLKSFGWRKPEGINPQAFFACARKYHVNLGDVWDTLIINSVKPKHPLNAEILHNFLVEKPLAVRDAIWTTYINSLDGEESRVLQIAKYYNTGNKFNGETRETVKLILVLFAWFLTSTNRYLRDTVSKAMVEILRYNFELCQELLDLFKDVNDPYVVQRLYGVVCGACLRRDIKYSDEYKKLSTYVYNQIFNKEKVVADVLLRDYARIIIERCFYECKELNNVIIEKIRPPYKSDDIPVVEKEKYANDESHGWYRIETSMSPNCNGAPHMYGDFGRYTFQSLLSNFENSDILNLYHYAMQYIKNVLGYDESLLGSYDYKNSRIRYDRGYGDIERIGKKYQWIVLYHIYARMADNHKIKKYYEDEAKILESLWDENIRDFDPSFNWERNGNISIPKLHWFEIETGNQFIKANSADEEIKLWTESTCDFFESHKKRLAATCEGEKWIVLESHEKISFIRSILRNWVDSDKVGEQTIWETSNAYFIKNSDWQSLKENLIKKDLYNERFPECDKTSNVYQGEYPWALNVINNKLSPWQGLVLKTGATHIEEYEVPDIIWEYSRDDSGFTIKENGKKMNHRVVEDEEVVCKVMPAIIELSWTRELDHSIDERGHSVSVPCVEIVEHFNLNAKNSSGFYFAPNGDLVCFDAYTVNKEKGLVIRKDYLDRFLYEKDYTLVWACIGEKQFFKSGQSWGIWSGLFYYQDEKIMGDFKNENIKI